MVVNTGISFGWQIPQIVIISLLALVVIFYCWWRGREWGWWLVIVGGGLNLIERLVLGGVRDYWPILGTKIYNNLNDYLIFIGVVAVLWQKWKKSK